MVEIAIHGLHHNAYRCRDAEKTRCFYEDFLGLPLAEAFEITTTQTTLIDMFVKPMGIGIIYIWGEVYANS